MSASTMTASVFVLTKAGRTDSSVAELPGRLVVPDNAIGIVAFAHGSGSSAASPRNRAVAGKLEESRCATLLFDLLTEQEQGRDAVTGELRFDIGLLGARLVDAVDQLGRWEQTTGLPIGLFGASTGAAAALVAAAERSDRVGAVVSRGGRPDLAGAALGEVRAPTLLVVGGRDQQVLALNRAAAQQLTAPVTIEVVPGATHLFEEPGALERVSELAAHWFRTHLEGRTP